jgi:hypothetical protein
MRYSVIIAAAFWISCGLLAAMGLIADDNADPAHDASCRAVNSKAVCDHRLRSDESIWLMWGLWGGPVALIVSAGFTGFYQNGFAWHRISTERREP